MGTAAAAVGVGMQVALGRVAVEGSRPVVDNRLAVGIAVVVLTAGVAASQTAQYGSREAS